MNICKAVNCDVTIDQGKVLCSRHWAMVPFRFKRRLWRHWKRQQLMQYGLVLEEALLAVAIKERSL